MNLAVGILELWLCISAVAVPEPNKDSWRLHCGDYEDDEVSDHFEQWLDDHKPPGGGSQAVIVSSANNYEFEARDKDSTANTLLCEGGTWTW